MGGRMEPIDCLCGRKPTVCKRLHVGKATRYLFRVCCSNRLCEDGSWGVSREMAVGYWNEAKAPWPTRDEDVARVQAKLKELIAEVIGR